MQLQKEVKSNPVVKTVCSPQEGHCEKRVKSKVAAKKWLNGNKLMAKFSIMTIEFAAKS